MASAASGKKRKVSPLRTETKVSKDRRAHRVVLRVLPEAHPSAVPLRRSSAAWPASLRHRPETPDYFLQAAGNLAQRTDFRRFEQHREAILTAFDNIGQFVQRAFGFVGIFLLE